MTFQLKNYAASKKDFEETIDIYLKGHGDKESIQDLLEPRKSQIQFLADLILKLNTLGAPGPVIDSIFYAAQSLICHVIGSSGNSQLRARLLFSMGITVEYKPSTSQYKTAYQRLNHLFKSFFATDNLCQVITIDRGLKNIPLDTLCSLMKTSYQLEAKYREEEMADYTPGAPELLSANLYKTKQPFPDKVPKKNWSALTEVMYQCRVSEIADKRIAEISEVPNKKRLAQFYFIQLVYDALNQISNAGIKTTEKEAILLGVMYIVKTQIDDEYAGLLNSLFTTPDGSVIYKELVNVLDPTNALPEHIEALVNAANLFILYMTTDSQKIRTKHIFSDIPEFSLMDVLATGRKIITDCRIKALDAAMSQYNKNMAAAPSAPSLISRIYGSFFGPSNQTTVPLEQITINSGNAPKHDEEHKESPSATLQIH